MPPPLYKPDNLQAKAKVFGIGLHKTGTSSLCLALEELGYTALHGSKKNSDLITKAMYERKDPFCYVLDKYWRSKKLPKDAEFNGYADIYAIIDHFPFFEQLYPDAKFILTTRENERWVKSLKNQIAVRPDSPYFHYWYYQNELQWIARKEMHESTVRDYFSDKPEKLLVLDITKGDGFEKLCPFLGVETLQKAFPHENNTSDKARMLG